MSQVLSDVGPPCQDGGQRIGGATFDPEFDGAKNLPNQPLLRLQSIENTIAPIVLDPQGHDALRRCQPAQ
jgi:hypothetical protein